ncbi:unnamed protein product [Medioppia subpectinata]|uniref:Uncharacterized protein n=1 Tax=Medioppia subpectinata TaxID=1979941 RepID=A0A7R9L775_9ACAR|nr:unnamed protein product [Medioppia subpectinata]CAG2116618.1 unnamed protein product [Medioppia subpectinata]
MNVGIIFVAVIQTVLFELSAAFEINIKTWNGHKWEYVTITGATFILLAIIGLIVVVCCCLCCLSICWIGLKTLEVALNDRPYIRLTTAPPPPPMVQKA